MAPTLSFYDRHNVSLGELGGWTDLSAAWKWNNAATAVALVPEIPDLFAELARCQTETVLAAVDDRLHWTGRVTDVEVRMTVTVGPGTWR